MKHEPSSGNILRSVRPVAAASAWTAPGCAVIVLAGLAFCAALLWALHPVQTEAVTYIIQRSESLMTLFYLLTPYCFIRVVKPPDHVTWHVAAVARCHLGEYGKALEDARSYEKLGGRPAPDFLKALRLSAGRPE